MSIPLFYHFRILHQINHYIGASKRGEAPLFSIFLPLMIGIYIHIMGKGIKGMRLIIYLNNSKIYL